MKLNKGKLFRGLKLALVLYAIIGIGIYYLQDYIFFHPVPLGKQHRYTFQDPYREVNLPYSEGSNINIIQFTTVGKPRGCVLYFHGNRRNISWYARHAPLFTSRHFEVWMIDYPGFGKSTGTLREDVLHAYATQMYKLARKSFSADSIILFGKSMGTGIAARLASRETARSLILETPYYSFESLAKFYFPIYPVQSMIRNKLPTNAFMPDIAEPICILHGTRDWIIPYSNAQKLRPLLKKDDVFITIPGGGHNNLDAYPQFHHTLDQWLR